MTPYSEDLRQGIVDTASRGDGTLSQIAERFLVNDRLTRLYSAQQDAVQRPLWWDRICVMVVNRRPSGYRGLSN